MESGDTSCASSVSFKRVRLPPLGTPSQKLGIESLQSFDRIQPHIALLNERAIISLSQDNLQQALQFLQQAERLLQLVAARGKAIDRQLIIAILTNEAHVYQQQGHLQWAHQYLQAVLYNIQNYLNDPQQLALAQRIHEQVQAENYPAQRSPFATEQGQAISIFLNRTYHQARVQLEFSWLLSLQKKHEQSSLMATESIRSMVSHLHYCRIYSNQPSLSSSNVVKIVDNIRQDCQMLSNLGIWAGQGLKYSQDKMWQYDEHQTYQLSVLRLKDFLKISLQEYQVIDDFRPKLFSNKDNPISVQRYALKMASIACGMYLFRDQKIIEDESVSSAFKSSTIMSLQFDFDSDKENFQKQMKAYALSCIKIVTKYMPSGSDLVSQLTELMQISIQQDKQEKLQLPNIQVSEVDSFQNMEQDEPVIKININTVIGAPAVLSIGDNFALDLSSADSIDINCSSEMIEPIKTAKQGFSFGNVLQPETYFDFMPKKKSNLANPLFQGTNNLQSLKKEQMKLQSTNSKESPEISLEQILESNKKRQQERKKQMLAVIQSAPKVNQNEQKWFLKTLTNKKSKKSKSKKISQTQLLSHSISNNSIFLSKREKSFKKNPQINSFPSVPVVPNTLKSQDLGKKIKAKGSIDCKIKMNRIKSPMIKNDKIISPKNTEVNAKSRSKNKLTKVTSKSKPKGSSSAKKNILSKGTKQRFQPVYYHKK